MKETETDQENLSQEEKEQRVYNLTIELKDMELKKKSHMGAYNNEIKRLKAEIKNLISDKLEMQEVI